MVTNDFASDTQVACMEPIGDGPFLRGVGEPRRTLCLWTSTDCLPASIVSQEIV